MVRDNLRGVPRGPLQLTRGVGRPPPMRPLQRRCRTGTAWSAVSTRVRAEGYLAYYNHDRVHHGRLTQGRIPADLIYGAHKMEPSEPHLSAHPEVRQT
jgi:hypothetical protein